MSAIKFIARVPEAEPQANILFIHGLQGNHVGSWTSNSGSYWPAWLPQAIHQEHQISTQTWSLDYRAPAFRVQEGGNWTRREQSKAAINAMLAKGLHKLPTCLICHSRGGLLAKEMLNNCVNFAPFGPTADSLFGIGFIATPHRGSPLAPLGKFIPFLSEQLRELFDYSTLMELHEAFVHNFSPLSKQVSVGVWYEKRRTRFANIVPRRSGDIQIPWATSTPIGEDHIGIVKPIDHNSVLSRSVNSFIATSFLRYQQPARINDGEFAVSPMPTAERAGAPAIPAPEHCIFRETEIGLVLGYLSNPSTLPMAVVGHAGAGKSTVIAAALSRLATTDGRLTACLIRCDGVRNIQELCSAICSRLNIKGGADPHAAVTSGLRARAVVLALDDLESLLQCSEPSHTLQAISEWVCAPETFILCGIRGPVQPYGIAWHSTVSVPLLSKHEAQSVLAAHAGKDTEWASSGDARKLAGLSEGLPLVLSILGRHCLMGELPCNILEAWASAHSMAKAASSPHVLDPSSADRTHSLHAAIQIGLSNPSLPSQEVSRFRVLGELPSGIESAQQGLFPHAPVGEGFWTLRTAGISHTANGREALLRPIRDYARHVMPPTATEQLSILRTLAPLLQRVKSGLNSPAHDEWLDLARGEHSNWSNLASLIDRNLPTGTPPSPAVVEFIYLWIDIHGPLGLSNINHSDGLIRRLITAPSTEGGASTRLLQVACNHYTNFGATTAAQWYADRIEALPRTQGSPNLGRALLSAGTLHYRLEQFQQAEELYREGLKIAELEGDHSDSEVARSVLAELIWFSEGSSGPRRRELRHLILSQIRAKASSKPNRAVGRAFRALAKVQAERRRLGCAKKLYSLGQSLADECGDTNGSISSALGAIEIDVGEPALLGIKAAQYAEQIALIIERARRLDDPLLICRALFVDVICSATLQRKDRARNLSDEAVELAQARANGATQAKAMFLKAMILEADGRAVQAEKLRDQGRQTLKASGLEDMMA